jgi:hypothetical protein
MLAGTPIQNIERDPAGFRRLVLAVGAFAVALAAFPRANSSWDARP